MPRQFLYALLLSLCASLWADTLPTPPAVWQDYDPDTGDFKEEIVREATTNGVYERDSYISAYVNGEEVRVFCKYAVKAGAKNAPALLNVHGWMGGPSIDRKYVDDGWAVMSHDYSGITKREHHTKYPKALSHGHMEARKMGFSLIYDRMPDGSQLTDPKATSHYLWNAVQRRALSYLLSQKEVDKTRVGAKGYSYGGTIMWNLAMDPRVKAVVACRRSTGARALHRSRLSMAKRLQRSPWRSRTRRTDVQGLQARHTVGLRGAGTGPSQYGKTRGQYQALAGETRSWQNSLLAQTSSQQIGAGCPRRP
jgi:dienelactone hydrolase